MRGHGGFCVPRGTLSRGVFLILSVGFRQTKKTMEAEAEAFRRTQSATPATTAPAAAAKVAPPAVGQATAAPPGRKRQGGVSASAAQLISKRRARSSQMK